MASKGDLTAWTDDATGTRYIQIEGKIYEQVGPGCAGRRPPDAGSSGDPGWPKEVARAVARLLWDKSSRLGPQLLKGRVQERYL